MTEREQARREMRPVSGGYRLCEQSFAVVVRRADDKQMPPELWQIIAGWIKNAQFQDSAKP